MNKKTKKYAANLLKIGITVVGLYLVLREVQPAVIIHTLSEAKLGWVFVGFLLVNISMALRAYRWSTLLRGVGATIKLKRLIALYYVGSFFNMFLLSGIGGDVVRILEAAREVPGNIATGTVLLDRFTGLLMLFVMALFALPFRPDNFPTYLVWLVVIGAVGGMVFLLLLMQENFLRWLGHWLPGPLKTEGDTPIARLLDAVAGCGWRAVGGALVISLLFNLLLALLWKTSSMALGLTVPYLYFVLVVPILAVLILIPSVGGLGPREMMAPLLFAAAGVLPETAVTLSFLVFLTDRLTGIMGAPIYLWTTIQDGRQGKRHAKNN
ncbi:MAG: flippase-like domain-containing protein [Anaerolineae bacterium]|nr:flippase-like domain-containing protein [Anaerolineae bacterium]